MKSVESKPAFLHDRKTQFSSVMSYAGEWVAPMIVWVMVFGVMLALVCVLVAPAE